MKSYKNPFILDSKDPVDDYKTFLTGETRYASLKKLFPEAADKLFEINEKEATERREKYKALANQDK